MKHSHHSEFLDAHQRQPPQKAPSNPNQKPALGAQALLVVSARPASFPSSAACTLSSSVVVGERNSNESDKMPRTTRGPRGGSPGQRGDWKVRKNRAETADRAPVLSSWDFA